MRRVRSSKPVPSKPRRLVARRFAEPSSGGDPGAPSSAPATHPAVAPLESVSQPPETARQMEPVKSPSAWVRAAAIRAVLLMAWTQ